MGLRLDLQKILEEILGSRNVYFQPPESVKIKYPAIIYNLDYVKTQHGDNFSYVRKRRYSITLITKDPDNEFVEKILDLKSCSFERFFTSDNLNHYVFNLYF